MDTVASAIAIVLGTAIVVATLGSAMVTVVVPRSERPLITRAHFRWINGAVAVVSGRAANPATRDRIESRLAAFALITLPFVWAVHITIGFALICWRTGFDSFVDALIYSGSALTTLGFRDADDPLTLSLGIIEALIGLGLVALMISYLPTIYGAYTDREVAVARLEVRAGRPPHPVEFLDRTNQIGWLGQMDAVWAEWEQWFLQIEETHTTHTSLSYFRSAHHGRSWIVAAGTVLDAAALIHSTLDVDVSPRAALCLRSGFTTLGSIADALGIERPRSPSWPDDTISLDRVDFDKLCDELTARGLPVVADRDQAWLGFAGWRVNYDASFFGLATTLRVPAGEWFESQVVVPTEGR